MCCFCIAFVRKILWSSVFCFLFKTPFKIYHPDSCQRSLITFISMLSSCTVISLTECVRGEYPEDKGSAVPEIEMGDTLCHTLAYVGEMGCFSLYNTSQA